jgi:hypothetical protein
MYIIYIVYNTTALVVHSQKHNVFLFLVVKILIKGFNVIYKHVLSVLSLQ